MEIRLTDVWLFSGSGAGVGKNTAADFMADELASRGFKVFRRSFAAQLKVMAAAKFGLDLDRMATDRAYKESIRPALIKLGNDERFLDPFVWVKLAENEFQEKIAEFIKLNNGITVETMTTPAARSIVIIDDCRYLNEPDFFKYYTSNLYQKTRVVYIHVNDETILERFGPEQFQKYIITKRDRSEREMKHYRRDYLISNDMTKEYLKGAVNAIVDFEYPIAA